MKTSGRTAANWKVIFASPSRQRPETLDHSGNAPSGRLDLDGLSRRSFMPLNWIS